MSSSKDIFEPVQQAQPLVGVGVGFLLAPHGFQNVVLPAVSLGVDEHRSSSDGLQLRDPALQVAETVLPAGAHL